MAGKIQAGKGGGVAVPESEATYRDLFLENPQPMWVCHRESGRILAVNEAALALYGYRRAEFLELSLSQLLGPETAPPASRGDARLSGPQLKKDGSSIELEQVWHSCRFAGEPALLVTLREGDPLIAECQRRLSEQSAKVEEAQRELETFSYSISHDLQAPLRHINGFSQALLDDYAATLDHEAQEYLTRISQAAGKMSRLIEAIQQLSRVTRRELERQPVNLSVAAQVISLELKHAAPQRQAEFAIEEGVSVVADPQLARQLLDILIGNSWKFSSQREKTRIEFGTREVEGERVYYVRDNGVGFDMCYAQKLFSLFHRLHRDEEFQGVGVGLAIAHRIVARHGGRIWAESVAGEGATFYFTL